MPKQAELESERLDSDRAYEIVVNAQLQSVPDETVTFEQVVEQAFPGQPPSETLSYAVSYRRAKTEPHTGTLVAGQSVIVRRKGTIFNVTQTDKS